MKSRILMILAVFILAAGCTKTATTTDPAKDPAPGPAPAASTPRLCELTAEPCVRDGKPCAEVAQCNVTLARLNPEGIPLDLNLDKAFTWNWKYATDGRLLESPTFLYTHKDDGTGERKSREGDRAETVKFDAGGRLVQIGDSGKITYTTDGRTEAVSHVDGGQTRSIHYRWGEKGKFTVDHNYPDSEEVCEPGPDEVTLDAQGRVDQEKFSSCQINYSPFSLKYEYDAQHRPVTLDVTCHPTEPTAVTWRVKMKYDCR